MLKSSLILKSTFKKRVKSINHVLVATEEEQPQQKRSRVETKNPDQGKEYYLASTLSSPTSNFSDSWWINSGATEHMTGFKKTLATFKVKQFHKKVELGDGSTFDIRGVGSTNIQLDSGTLINVEETLYGPSLKNNVISVTVLEDKGYSITFSKGKVLIWSKDRSIN